MSPLFKPVTGDTSGVSGIIHKFTIVRNNKIIYFCFFLSGAAGLMYEIIWARFFSLTYGSTTYSITTVLSAFMAGLAVGSLLFGRIADRIKRRLMFYGWIELLIGLYALLFPFLFHLSSRFYLSIIKFSEIDQIEKLALKFVLSFFIMFIPTTLMGGSLPVLSRFLIRDHAGVSSKLGSLYAVNTFGAVAGTYMIGFHMVAVLGLNASIQCAAFINIAVGIGIILYALKIREPAGRTIEEEPFVEKEPMTRREKNIIIFAVAAFMISGFVALSHEVVWTRILSMIIGSSTYAFTMILIGFLIGIALGSYLISHTRLIPHDRINLTTFSCIQIGIGLSTFVLIPLFSKLPLIMLNAFKINPDSYPFITLYQFILTLSIIILPTTLMGATLPVIGKIVSREVRSVGRSIGNIYFFNTFGAIFGSLFAGFLFIPYIGALNTLKLGIYINILLGIGGLLLATYKQKKKPVLFVSLVIAGIGLAGVRAAQWDTGLMDSGVSIYGKMIMKKQGGHEGLKNGSRPVYFHEGINATISIRKGENSISLKTNGKVDASTNRGDMTTQTLSGYLPLILHPHPQTALVIGLASGVTAGTVGQYDNILSLDIVEIEPSMKEAAGYFNEVNHNVIGHPKVNLIINDGRNHLLETEDTYDLIISEPSNPWISGIGSLYTVDYFDLVNKKLNPGGIFCQWVHFYSMSPENLKMILRTLALSFEDLQLWISNLGDILIIGSNRKITIDPIRIEQVMNLNDKTKTDFSNYMLAEYPTEIIGRLLLDKNEILSLSSGAQINSDNYPYLEFRAPKDLYLDHRAAIYRELTKRAAAKPPEPLMRIKNEKDLAAFYLHRSKIYTDVMKWFTAAHQYIRKALEYDSTWDELYFQLGRILFIEKRYSEAENTVKKGLSINTSPSGIHILVDIFQTSGRPEKALELLDEHRHLMKKYELIKAYMLYSKGQYEQAVPYLEEALKKKQGGEYFILNMIGNCYKELGRRGKAETYYLKSIQQEDMNKNAQLSLGGLYWEQGRFEEACKVYSFLDRYWETDASIQQRLFECSTKPA
jgi:spermidine synthase